MSVGSSAARWTVRGSVVGLLVVLCLLAGFTIIIQHREAALSDRVVDANALSRVYQDARFWAGQEDSLEHKYQLVLEPGQVILRLHSEAEHNLTTDLRRLRRLDPSPANQVVVARLLSLNASYIVASREMFRAVDAHQPALAFHVDQAVAEPVFGAMDGIISRNAASASRRSLALTTKLHADDAAETSAIATAFGLGMALLVGLGLVIAFFLRRLDRSLVAEVKRLGEVAITDPLTGLRNHRAFQEDLEICLHRAGRAGAPISLVMLDLDRLKAVNDTLGHQAGDERLTMLADSLRSTERGTDQAYRIGGDEFAVILDGARAWHALEFTQRLAATLAAASEPDHVSASAGIAERLEYSDKDALIREAGLAMIASKRSGQAAAIYTPEMEREATPTEARDERQTRTLADALALAVDAKDSYTRSHSQTVSQLSVLIATELGFDPAHIAQMRVAGLLHDVGKIGIPDAILNKRDKLTDSEYEQMKTHATLGHAIFLAAGLSTEAEWILHHHSRLDGRGYPDRISGEAIPLESRIIVVADAFEAMTSDRPYREARGQQFAIDELHRHSGTQFDPQVVGALCRTLGQPTTGRSGRSHWPRADEHGLSSSGGRESRRGKGSGSHPRVGQPGTAV
jgi:diguanylate cyclase (GGDEF)-like protein